MRAHSVSRPLCFAPTLFRAHSVSRPLSERFGILALFLACFLVSLPRLACAQVNSVSVFPNAVSAGSQTTGTVTLLTPAPTGGAIVSLSSSDSYAAGVPGSVVIAEGGTSATFPVCAGAVNSSQNVTLTATYQQTATTTLAVAFTAALSLAPTDDAYIQSGSINGNTNFGLHNSYLIVKRDAPVSDYDRCVYLKFDLSQVPASPPIGAATLRLNSRSNPGGGSITVKCYSLSDTSWSEGGITGNNAPGLSSSFTSTGTYINSQVVYETPGADC